MSDRPKRPMGGSIDAIRQLHAYERYADEMDTYIAEFEAKVARLAADRESKAEDDDKMWDVIINEIDPLGQG